MLIAEIATRPIETITLYRGEYSGNRGGSFYSPDREFARQFTQGGQEHEVKTVRIPTSTIYRPPQPVYAGDPDAVDAVIAQARQAGFKAVWLSEGHRQPDSVYIFDKTVLRRMYEDVDANLLPMIKQRRDRALAQYEQMKDAGADHNALAQFFHKNVYPLNKKIEDMEKRVDLRGLVAKSQQKGTTEGFDTDEILYHGTEKQFDRFDRKFSRTAAHIYTSPDIDTARKYGAYVYRCFGRQQPQADISNNESPQQGKLIQRIFHEGDFASFGYDEESFAEDVTNGDLYKVSSRIQDAVVDTALSLGYRSVRIVDGIPSSWGGYSHSVIFESPDDLMIVDQIKEYDEHTRPATISEEII